MLSHEIKRIAAPVFFLVAAFVLVGCEGENSSNHRPQELAQKSLPAPRYSSEVSLEQALLKRRSQRKFSNLPMEIEEISQLLWAAQGVTGTDFPFRTAPSAGALYPLEIYLVAGNISRLESGIYHYQIGSHSLSLIERGDKREALSFAALKQNSVLNAAATLVITGIFQRSSKKYGKKGVKYSYMEAGHVGQNLCLQAEALGLATVPVGAMDEKKISEVLSLPGNETPLYLFPLGKKP